MEIMMMIAEATQHFRELIYIGLFTITILATIITTIGDRK